MTTKAFPADFSYIATTITLSGKIYADNGTTNGFLLLSDLYALGKMSYGADYDNTNPATNGQLLVYIGGTGKWTPGKAGYNGLPTAVQNLPFVCSIAGTPGADQQVWTIPVLASGLFTLPAGLSGSVGYAGTLAAATAVFSLSYLRAGVVTSIGSVTFGTASHNATFSAASGYTAVAGDVLILKTPATADTTLANVGIVILAQKA